MVCQRRIYLKRNTQKDCFRAPVETLQTPNAEKLAFQFSKPVQCAFCLCYKVQKPPFLFRNLDILESVRFEIC